MSWIAAIALLAAALIVAGCAQDDENTVTVGAAASLVAPLNAFADGYEERHPGTRVRREFAGSDTIAARIRQGVAIDVYISADAGLAEGLAADGLVGTPRAVARNRVVVAARKDGPVGNFDDLTRPEVKVAIGGPNVPIGAYAREALSARGDGYAIRVMENVTTNELDVRGVIGKIELGVVDAGIVYQTDVSAFDSALTVLPFELDDTPPIIYSAAVRRDSSSQDEAQRFVSELASPAGRRPLEDAGFAAP